MGYIVDANNKDHITFEGGTMELMQYSKQGKEKPRRTM